MKIFFVCNFGFASRFQPGAHHYIPSLRTLEVLLRWSQTSIKREHWGFTEVSAGLRGRVGRRYILSWLAGAVGKVGRSWVFTARLVACSRSRKQTTIRWNQSWLKARFRWELHWSEGLFHTKFARRSSADVNGSLLWKPLLLWHRRTGV